MNDLMDFIQQVKRANDIVSVIGSYLELRQRGTNHIARCPFHGEKTPSFNVNQNRQIYKCFGCGESGDVIKFVQMYESLTFMEALEVLAKRAGLKMPETASQKKDKTFEEKKKKRDVYLEICKNTAVFYYKTFYSERGAVARKYMLNRGFSEETLKKFGIGYSPDMYSLVKFLDSKGYSREDCLKCGVLQSKRDGTAFDALANRVIVPIFNISGKVIAFGGRGIDQDTINYGKYKNTQDTPLFNKSENLFALNLVKEQKQQTALPNIVMVEGYMDVIAMYQAGFRRAVASMGTSLTENQAKLLSRLTDTVYICYDGDAAGQKATVRGLDILDVAGLEIRVMSIPNNLDPDEYIKAHGAEEFEKLVLAALPLPDYKLQLLEKTFPINSDDAAVRNNALPKYVSGAIKMLKQLDDVRREQYLAVVSLKTGYSQEYFRRKVAETNDETPTTPTDVQGISTETKAKYFVAASLLTNQPYAKISEKPYCESAFLANLFDYVWECRQNGVAPALDMLYSVCPNATQEEYSQIVDVDFSPDRQEINEKYFEECKNTIILEKLKQQQAVLKERYKAEPDNPEIIQKIKEISDKISELTKRR